VYLYLCVTLAMYAVLTRHLVGVCEEKKAHWARLDKTSTPLSTPRESREPVKSNTLGTPRGMTPRRRSNTQQEVRQTLGRLKRRPTMFGPEDGSEPPLEMFAAIRDYFVTHLCHPEAPLHRSLKAIHNDHAPTKERFEKFRLSWYFREEVDHCTVQLVTLGSSTWLYLAVWFAVLAVFAAFLHVTYKFVMCAVAASSFGVLVFMYYTSVHRRNVLEKMMFGEVKAPDDVTGHINFSSGTTLGAMRCFSLVLLYGAVQFLGSNFCWTYYPYWTAGFAALVLGACCVWCLNWAYIIPVYAAAMALPPFYDPANAHLHAAHICNAVLDDAEWSSDEEAAEAGMIAD